MLNIQSSGQSAIHIGVIFMTTIPFFKMSGSGNDFIIIDNRDHVIDDANLPQLIENVCRRRLSAGADGLILVEASSEADFQWRFFNSDGGRAEMCGNGARCAARFAYLNEITGQRMSFVTDAGKVHAQVLEDQVKIQVTDPVDLKLDYTIDLEKGQISISSINTGVPHVVVPVDRIDDVEVVALGREIRYHKVFAPAGTNANFVSPVSDQMFSIRTYERGVEDETLACGTGAVASALIMATKMQLSSPIHMMTRSGSCLTVHFSFHNGRFQEVELEGDARVIYNGALWEDAWNYTL